MSANRSLTKDERLLAAQMNYQAAWNRYFTAYFYVPAYVVAAYESCAYAYNAYMAEITFANAEEEVVKNLIPFEALQARLGYQALLRDIKERGATRIIMGRSQHTNAYINHINTGVPSHLNEKDSFWCTSNPAKSKVAWTIEWNEAYWAAGIEQKLEFHLVTNIATIVERAHLYLPPEGKRISPKQEELIKHKGVGGTVAEILWLLDNNYSFKKEEDGRVVARPTALTPKVPIIRNDYDRYNVRAVQQNIKRLDDLYKQITGKKVVGLIDKRKRNRYRYFSKPYLSPYDASLTNSADNVPENKNTAKNRP